MNICFQSVYRAHFLFLVSILLFSVRVQGQYTLDREPTGPSSRKTGLVISEIMYHPVTVPAFTNLDLQFIELYNSNPWDENISGFSIGGSVEFTIPTNTVLHAGEYIVIARHPDLLQPQYSITNVLGPWIGASTNALPVTSGTVQLLNPIGALFLAVNYDGNLPWPPAADGKGHSLVLARPSFGQDNPRAWIASDVIGGSPGVADPIGVEPLAGVFINEYLAHTDLPLRDYIELYNHNNTAVDLSGAYLTDDPDTNRFRIPNGTTIPARGYVFYDDSTMPFSLFAEGEQIFLVNSNQTRVIDVVDFPGQSNGVSSGRSPDGASIHYGLATRTPGARNSVPKRYAVVINEVMFNPLSGSDDDEYVEIYNRNATPINIGAWFFVNGISFTFPSNTFMGGGAYWVLARNPTNLLAIYPNLTTNNTFGPYNGTLANGGERLTLAAADYDNVVVNGQTVSIKLDVTASELLYNDGGRWGNWTDGGGSSLELIDPEADTHLPSNWADSDTSSDSPWTSIELTMPLSETLGTSVNDQLIIMLQGLGECLLDEIEVRVDNGPNLVPNGGFESGLTGWSLQGSHDVSTLENIGFAGNSSLHLRAGSRGDNQSNRILSPPLTSLVPANAGAVTIRAKARWIRGHPELLLRLHGGGAEAYGRLALPRRLGTPGMINSRVAANAGPAIHDVSHLPILPAADEAVIVTARAVDPQGIAALTLRYRVDPSPDYVNTPMVDNGTNGDAVANDGIYSGTFPGQASGVMVAFYVQGHDNTGASATFPKNVFPPPGLPRCWPNDAVARECVVRFGEIQMPGSFPTYHLWVTAVNSNRWQTRDAMNNSPLDGTFVYNNSRLIYNALPLYSGSPWHREQTATGPAGAHRVDYEMNFPDDDPLLDATDFILNNPGNPTLTTLSDLSAVGEQTVYKVMEGMGMVQNHRRYVHLFVNGSQRSTTPQRSGNFIFEDSQQPNSDMIEQWYPNVAGQLFKVEDWFEFEPNGYDIAANNDADLTRRAVMIDGEPTLTTAPYRFMFRKRIVTGGASANDYSVIFDLIDAVSPPDNPTSPTIDPALFGAVADWEQWMRIFAVQRTVGNFDSYGWERGKNDYLFKPGTGPFQHMTWDIDYSLGLGRPPQEPLFASNDPRVTAMFNTPAIVRAYWRAFEELISGPFSNEYLDPFIDSRIAALVASDVNVDLDAVTAIKSFIAQRRAFLQSQVATITVPFAVEGTLTFETTNNLVELFGSAPVGAKEIALNGVIYPVVWTSVTNFMLRLVVDSDLNVINLQGLDRLGNPLLGITQQLNITYTGPRAFPMGSLIINEVMVRSAVPRGQFVEIINRSEQNFDLSGWRLDGLGFTFPPGSIMTNGQIAVLAQSRDAFSAAYGNQPLFSLFNPNLSQQGQTLRLVKPGMLSDTLIDVVRYESTAPWPVTTAGQSLQLIDNTQDNSRPSNWALDALNPATPGTTNSVASTLPPYDPLWLNELLALNLNGPQDGASEHEPWLEIHNSGLTTMTLDGYYLADNFSNVVQWAFPPGLTIGPGEFKLIWADGEPGETSGQEIHTSLRFAPAGSLALSRMVSGQPQITDYLKWAGLNPNLAYGSLPDGQLIDRLILYRPTPLGTNASSIPRLYINEWLARNNSVLRDPADQSFDDCFEIYNGESTALNLGGYYLTDNPDAPTKFQVPNNGRYIIPARGFLLVWADGTPNQNTANRPDLHVSFQLGGSSGDLQLYAPDGLQMIDAIGYGLQTNDISEGRFSDGASAIYYMTKATPRAANLVPAYNTPPVFQPITNQVLFPGQTLTMSVRAVDPEALGVTYSIDQAPPGSLINQAGLFRWVVPAAEPPGVRTVVIRATDNGVPPMAGFGTFTMTIPSSTSTNTTEVIPPMIYLVASHQGQATFTFNSIVGRTYRILYKNDLSDPAWIQLDRDFVAANFTASITDPVTAPQRFYQVLQVN